MFKLVAVSSSSPTTVDWFGRYYRGCLCICISVSVYALSFCGSSLDSVIFHGTRLLIKAPSSTFTVSFSMESYIAGGRKDESLAYYQRLQYQREEPDNTSTYWASLLDNRSQPEHTTSPGLIEPPYNSAAAGDNGLVYREISPGNVMEAMAWPNDGDISQAIEKLCLLQTPYSIQQDIGNYCQLAESINRLIYSQSWRRNVLVKGLPEYHRKGSADEPEDTKLKVELLLQHGLHIPLGTVQVLHAERLLQEEPAPGDTATAVPTMGSPAVNGELRKSSGHMYRRGPATIRVTLGSEWQRHVVLTKKRLMSQVPRYQRVYIDPEWPVDVTEMIQRVQEMMEVLQQRVSLEKPVKLLPMDYTGIDHSTDSMLAHPHNT